MSYMNQIPASLITRITLDEVATHLSTGYSSRLSPDSQVLLDFIMENLYTGTPQLPKPMFEVAIITGKLRRWLVWEGLCSLSQSIYRDTGDGEYSVRENLRAWIRNPSDSVVCTRLRLLVGTTVEIPAMFSFLLEYWARPNHTQPLELAAQEAMGRTNNYARNLSARESCKQRCSLLYLLQNHLPDEIPLPP